MPARGNPKGTNNGGGMPAGKKIARTVERETAALMDAAVKRVAGRKLGKDIMSEAANYFFGLAAKYQPTDNNPLRDEKKFEAYLLKASNIASQVAPYESQRLSAVQVTQMPADLTKLSDQELDDLERLLSKTADTSGSGSGEIKTIN